MIDWAREIRKYREAHGLRQEALAEKLGVSQATISRWESGRQRPDIESQSHLRPLLWSGLIGGEALMLHAVRAAPTICAVADRQGRLLAASRAFAGAVGIAPPVGERVRYDLNAVSPDAFAVFEQAREAGLFDGRLASVSLTSRALLREGTLHSREFWYPLRLDSGEIVVRADIEVRRDLGSAAERGPPRPRLVRIEDVIADVGGGEGQGA
jgi:transcriptional regulator with XRE-family HTH domain